MRHDPASGAIVIMLRSLKMYGMSQAVTDLIEQGAPAFEGAVPILSQLLKAEVAEREVRSIAYHMKAARFPANKDLAGFNFAASDVNEATVRQLHRCEFLEGAQNVVLFAINQLDVVLRGEITLLVLVKIVLTFAVPYLVSTYSALQVNRLGTS